MSELVEKVAEALAAHGLIPDDGLSDDYVGPARAAIAVVLEALREPTEAMLSAGQIDHGSYAAMLAAFTRTALDAETEDKPC